MSASLSNLVNNLSEIYKKEYKGFEERRKIKSVCSFIGLKNNKLNYEYKECNKKKVTVISKRINQTFSKYTPVFLWRY